MHLNVQACTAALTLISRSSCKVGQQGEGVDQSERALFATGDITRVHEGIFRPGAIIYIQLCSTTALAFISVHYAKPRHEMGGWLPSELFCCHAEDITRVHEGGGLFRLGVIYIQLSKRDNPVPCRSGGLLYTKGGPSQWLERDPQALSVNVSSWRSWWTQVLHMFGSCEHTAYHVDSRSDQIRTSERASSDECGLSQTGNRE